MQILQLIKLLLSILPLIIEVVQAIETALPQGTKGQTKLALVQDTVKTAYDAVNQTSTTYEQVSPLVTQIVSNVVSTFNDTGVFKK